MSNQKFIPSHYKGKKTVYVSINNVPEISSIWDWVDRKKKYCKRSIGLKFYAVKRVNGKQVTKCFSALNEARDWKNAKELEIDTESEEILFEELLEMYFSKKKSEIRISTFETYQSKAKHLEFFNGFAVKSITPKTIDLWLQSLKAPRYLSLQHGTRLTYRHELSLLRQVLDFYSEYVCDDNSYSIPIKKRHRKDCVVDRVKSKMSSEKNKRKFLPRKLIFEFLRELRKRSLEKPENEVYFVLGLFQFSTGTRIGEACAIDWIDVDLQSSKVFIHRNVCWSRKKGRETFISELTKTGESRSVLMTRDLGFFPV